MNKLIIDTTEGKKTTIELQLDEEIDRVSQDNVRKSQKALILIDQLLKRNKILPTDIDEIEVNTGPGSFTGTRVGVAFANALGFGLNVKVNGSKSKQAAPRYS